MFTPPLTLTGAASRPRPFSARLQRFARVLPHRVRSAPSQRRTAKHTSLTDRWAQLYASARTLGLHTAQAMQHRWQAPPQPEVAERAAQLLAAASINSRDANASEPTRLHAAFGYFGDFCAYLPGRDMFMRPRFRGDLDAEAYNEATFSMFAQFLRDAVAPPLRSNTIGGHVSTIKTFIERELSRTLLPPSRDQKILPRLLKHFRAGDGPGTRKLRLAFRGRHLKALASIGHHRLDQSTYEGQLNWAILLVGHNFLCRGGELGRPEGSAFKPESGMLVISDRCVQFGTVTREGVTHAAAVVWLMSIKDGARRQKPMPMLLLKRGDSLCAYTALLRLLHTRRARTPPAEWHLAPLFAAADGTAIDTAYVRDLVRDMAAALGLPRGLFGSTSLRIGGATDLYDLYHAGGERLIKERGRWRSDIAEIYQRASASLHLHASATMADAAGLDLESFALGWRRDHWAQPSR